MYSLNSNSQNLIINHSVFDLNSSKKIVNPYCIVIGCKNGENRCISSGDVKFYQVPNLATSNTIARQWYINTLREDLLENILQTKQSAQHFVCIEHFDEESFLIAKDPSEDADNVIMILKEDAVPSLFEIEVFQKMISHQEQFTLNQQKLTIQTKPNIPQFNKPKNNLLQNLILNVDQSLSQASKRTRIDPDTRAALIQRVPKAVKRTAVMNIPKPIQQEISSPKLQKAIKHTFAKAQPVQMVQEAKNAKIQKAVKHTTSAVNSILKDILPPPIMQSTKRASNSTVQNKAVKHTSPLVPAPVKQPLTQVNQNSQLQQSITPTSGNKITITTTYVYKRVLQAPEIDLNLECEEEEIVYIKAPPKQEQEKPKEIKKENKEIKEIEQPKKEPETKPKEIEKPETKSKQQLKIKNDHIKSNLNNHTNELAKFYSRRLGAIKLSIEKKKQKTNFLPLDLRAGKYPAKCNICDLILENNIELTSHICSHLESNDLPTELNTYISPFDAVTTTCGVCEAQFSHPFQLIKHLDTAHMKQLAEYKCRICEKQHDKLGELIDHLNKNHSEQEMPYRCDACGFRTSFYADAIYHIKTEHINTLRHFCPYCLKSLVLPFNKKLGYVQCNIFYSHLITHFNKHENDVMIPSKCKHCSKCILHIRHMKEHLIFDHNSVLANDEEKSSEDEKKEDYDDKIELDLVNAEKDLKRRLSNKCSKSEASNEVMSLRKRKRSFNEQKNDSELENSDNESIKLDMSEFDKTDEVKLDDSLRDKLKTETVQKIRKRRTSEYSNLIKKAQSIKTAKNEFNEVKTEQKQEQLDSSVKPEQEVFYKKKQKALKQTNIKPNMQRRRFRSSNYGFDRERSPSCSPTSALSQKISTLIYGNVKFSCIKNQFKCVECGECDLKSHYRTDYECHQCKYNTSCSKSFEYHLHGHLVSKRVALWNKSQKIEFEEYNCPCGFSLNSDKDNHSNSNSGNKVAEHLANCDYKFCYFKSSAVEHEYETENETIQNLQNQFSKEKLNKSDEIILNDSMDDITEI